MKRQVGYLRFTQAIRSYHRHNCIPFYPHRSYLPFMHHHHSSSIYIHIIDIKTSYDYPHIPLSPLTYTLPSFVSPLFVHTFCHPIMVSSFHLPLFSPVLSSLSPLSNPILPLPSIGHCKCFPAWTSSDGRGGPGSTGDCGYRNDMKYSARDILLGIKGQ